MKMKLILLVVTFCFMNVSFGQEYMRKSYNYFSVLVDGEWTTYVPNKITVVFYENEEYAFIKFNEDGSKQSYKILDEVTEESVNDDDYLSFSSIDTKGNVSEVNFFYKNDKSGMYFIFENGSVVQYHN